MNDLMDRITAGGHAAAAALGGAIAGGRCYVHFTNSIGGWLTVTLPAGVARLDYTYPALQGGLSLRLNGCSEGDVGPEIQDAATVNPTPDPDDPTWAREFADAFYGWTAPPPPTYALGERDATTLDALFEEDA